MKTNKRNKLNFFGLSDQQECWDTRLKALGSLRAGHAIVFAHNSGGWMCWLFLSPVQMFPNETLFAHLFGRATIPFSLHDCCLAPRLLVERRCRALQFVGRCRDTGHHPAKKVRFHEVGNFWDGSGMANKGVGSYHHISTIQNVPGCG